MRSVKLKKNIYFALFCSASLVVLFQRCSPIAPSMSKTLINGPGSNISPTDVAPLAFSQPSNKNAFLQIKAKVLEASAFAELTELSRISQTLRLDSAQIRDLKENHHTLIQLKEAPTSELTIYFEVSQSRSSPQEPISPDPSPESEDDGSLRDPRQRAKTANKVADVQLQPLNGKTWILSLAERNSSPKTPAPTNKPSNEGDSLTVSGDWILKNIRNVLIVLPQPTRATSCLPHEEESLCEKQ